MKILIYFGLSLLIIFKTFSKTIISNTSPEINKKSDSFYSDRLSLSFSSGEFDYSEVVGSTKKSFMSDKGMIFGPGIELRKYIFQKHFFLQSNFEYLYGKTNYDGGRNNGSEPLSFKTSNLIRTIEASLGSSIHLGKMFTLEIMAGAGFRKLLNPATEVDGDYTREIKYQYIPASVVLTKVFNIRNQSEIGFKYNHFLKGVATSYLDDSDPYATITMRQNNGVGYKVFFKHNYLLENYTLSVVPFFNYWHVTDSNTDTKIFFNETQKLYYKYTYREPDNKTLLYGLSFTISKIF